MRKILKVCVCGLVIAAVATGCSKKAADETTAADTTAASGEQAAGTDAATDAASEMVDLSALNNGTITLGEYKGIEVTKDAVAVTDEEIDAQVQSALDTNPDYVEVDRAIQDGDTANINYVGTKDGEAFEGGTADDYDLVIGSGSFIEGFEEGLVGAKKGEEKTLKLTFPETYQEESLAGKAVEFKVTVNSVKEKKEAVLDDAFVQKISGSQFKTVQEYKDNIRQTLLTQKESEAEQKLQSDILTKVIDNSQIETSQEAIDANYSNMVASYTNQAAAYGMDLASMASMFFGMDEETFRSQMQVMAEATVKQRLAFNAIAEKEKITVADEDRDSLATEMGYESREQMVEQAGAYTVDDYIISQKTMEFLVANAVVK